MKYITILLLLFTLACENKSKDDSSSSDTEQSTKDMEVYIDEGSIITLGDNSEIWVKRVFPEGKTGQVSKVNSKGKNIVYEYDGTASLIFFDCNKGIYIVDEIYYFLGDQAITHIDNRIERLENKNTWSKIETDTYVEKVSQIVCKPEEKE